MILGCSWEHPSRSPVSAGRVPGAPARSLRPGFASAAMDVPPVFVEALRSLLAPEAAALGMTCS